MTIVFLSLQADACNDKNTNLLMFRGQVEGLIVGEDVASSQNKTGGRAMVGEVLFYKVINKLSINNKN